MTAHTRRRLTVCLAIGLVTLPVEALLWPVIRTPDARTAAIAWASSRSAGELRQAAFAIERYPAVYRRAIMAALSPVDRSDAWRAELGRFLSAHPELSPSQAAVVRRAIDLASADAFTPPVSADRQKQIGDVFAEARVELGDRTAAELFVTLGPRDRVQANALPFSERLANHLRSWRVVSAEYPDCNCNIEIDTCDVGWDPWLVCSELYTCNFDLDWPMCGPFWAWACTGWCKVVQWPVM